MDDDRGLFSHHHHGTASASQSKVRSTLNVLTRPCKSCNFYECSLSSVDASDLRSTDRFLPLQPINMHISRSISSLKISLTRPNSHTSSLEVFISPPSPFPQPLKRESKYNSSFGIILHMLCVMPLWHRMLADHLEVLIPGMRLSHSLSLDRRRAHNKSFCVGAAAFAAMTAYEHKRANEGEPVSHAHAKQALAALAGFEVGAKNSPMSFF